MRLKQRLKAFINPEPADVDLVKQFKYDASGEFDYASYREAQVSKAHLYPDALWADDATMDLIAEHARKKPTKSDFVICHGSKAGLEAKMLGERLDCSFVGTDIAPPDTATNVIEWDFHEPNPDLIGKASVIYTNALDHAYDPKKAMTVWVDQLADGGQIFVEHSMLHSADSSTADDPFGAHPLIMPYLVLEWGEGRFGVTKILKPSHKKPNWHLDDDGKRAPTDIQIWVFVIEKFIS